MFNKIRFSIKNILLLVAILFAILFLFFKYFTVNDINLNLQHKKYESSLITIDDSSSVFLNILSNYVIKPFIEKYMFFYLNNYNLLWLLSHVPYDYRLIKINDINLKNGDKLMCGQKARIKIVLSYASVVIKEEVIDISTQNEKNKFLIYGMLNMTEGSTRNINIPFHLVKDFIKEVPSILPSSIDYTVTLEKIFNKYPNNMDKIKIFDECDYKQSESFMCGDVVDIHYEIDSIDGDRFLSKDVSFKIGGNSNVPLGIQLGSLYLKKHGKRTLIAPGNLLDNKLDNKYYIVSLFVK
ncbi:MAG: FKBP-type peptidyl-prolyl cis-trans isomerase [Anaplasmataceae bacterium]|nr:FKBP-type peptidyl-prolyl cis-trans isomerase [Anaplasmataceae bacterium]